MSKKRKDISVENLEEDLLLGMGGLDPSEIGKAKRGANPGSPEVNRLHKQPRNYLKTTSKLVGRETDVPSLFTQSGLLTSDTENAKREVLSRNTAILGNYLLQLWQENDFHDLEITNLGPIADMMGNTNYEIKTYLLSLGGFVYPILDTDVTGFSISVEQLFKIKFKYKEEQKDKLKDKYDAGELVKIGSTLSNFFKDEPIDRIIIIPNVLFLEALKGKGLGNVLVNNDFMKFSLGLSQMAYKLFVYSASNKPSPPKIKEVNLLTHLGLEKLVKTQGKPRVRQAIFKAFEELKEKGHFKSYSYDEKTTLFSFSYTDKYIKHKDGL